MVNKMKKFQSVVSNPANITSTKTTALIVLVLNVCQLKAIVQYSIHQRIIHQMFRNIFEIRWHINFNLTKHEIA